MTAFDDENLPHDLREVADRLRETRPSFTEFELDQLKLRAMANIPRRVSGIGQLKGKSLRSRILTLGVAALLVGGTAGGAIASGAGGKSGNAAYVQHEFLPGNGCGDENHVHTGPPGNPSNFKCPPQSDDNDSHSDKNYSYIYENHSHSDENYSQAHYSQAHYSTGNTKH